MTWLWADYAEWEQEVRPHHFDSSHQFESVAHESKFEQLQSLMAAADALFEVKSSGDQLLRGRDDKEQVTTRFVREAFDLVLDATLHAEQLLVRHRRLAMSQWARRFLSLAVFVEPETWKHVSTRKPLVWEMRAFVDSLGELLTGYTRLREDDDGLFRHLMVPESVVGDLDVARNLFGTGFDEMGLLATGKALEGVLREVAKLHKLTVHIGKRWYPGEDLSFADLIDAFAHFRTMPGEVPLIERKDAKLLHFLRELRNRSAHPGSATALATPCREQAIVVAETAKELWSRLGAAGLEFQSAKLEKDW